MLIGCMYLFANKIAITFIFIEIQYFGDIKSEQASRRQARWNLDCT